MAEFLLEEQELSLLFNGQDILEPAKFLVSQFLHGVLVFLELVEIVFNPGLVNFRRFQKDAHFAHGRHLLMHDPLTLLIERTEKGSQLCARRGVKL